AAASLAPHGTLLGTPASAQERGRRPLPPLPRPAALDEPDLRGPCDQEIDRAGTVRLSVLPRPADARPRLDALRLRGLAGGRRDRHLYALGQEPLLHARGGPG